VTDRFDARSGSRNTLRVALRHLNHDVLGGLYARLFARPSTQAINDALFYLALRGQGYNNGSDLESSGEGRFIRRLAGDDPLVCIDVGANVGGYSEALLTLTSARVIAFEPLPLAFAAVRQLGERFPGRLTAVNLGVGDTSAVVDLHYGSGDSEHASFSAEVDEIEFVSNPNTMPVQMTTLDRYFDEHEVPQIDLIKIDTEGYEHEVLVGARGTIERYRPRFIQIEYNLHQLIRMHSLLSLSKLLPGYRPFRVLPHGSGLHEIDPTQPQSNTYCYSNVVFVRNDLAEDI
jgi:FkbM family methyltransferase